MMKQKLLYLIVSATLALLSLNACQKPPDAQQEPKHAAPVTANDQVPRDGLAAGEDQQTPLPDNITNDCIVTPKEQPVACTMDYRPVCGCDAITYPNACAAGAAGVPRITQGACEGDDLN